jgi:3-oxoacyl-[acyl-carrier-protein] synthase II
MLIPNAPAGQVAIRFGAKGECKAVCTACAAGTMALGDAWRLLSCGEADVAIAGGAEGFAADHDAYALMGFDRLRTMSTRNDDPQRASRPFDKMRDGFVLGEGAAVLVLEREDYAKARGARTYALIDGYASNCDAGSMMQLDETGESIVALIRSALESAGRDVADINHVSAHGTSTVLNDKMETAAVKRSFRERAKQVPLSSIKSMIGHLIGAAGALEAVVGVLAIRDGAVPPTINLEVPDPECDLDYVPNEARELKVRAVLSSSFGFGGQNAALVIREYA